jgi:hypothetical protein
MRSLIAVAVDRDCVALDIGTLDLALWLMLRHHGAGIWLGSLRGVRFCTYTPNDAPKSHVVARSHKLLAGKRKTLSPRRTT